MADKKEMADDKKNPDQLPEGGVKASTSKINEKEFQLYFFRFPQTGRGWYSARRDWMKMTDEERNKELNKRCTRCKAKGHNCLECPLPIMFKKRVLFPITYSDGKRKYRCSRCHKLGHNILGCHGPLV